MTAGYEKRTNTISFTTLCLYSGQNCWRSNTSSIVKKDQILDSGRHHWSLFVEGFYPNQFDKVRVYYKIKSQQSCFSTRVSYFTGLILQSRYIRALQLFSVCLTRRSLATMFGFLQLNEADCFPSVFFLVQRFGWFKLLFLNYIWISLQPLVFPRNKKTCSLSQLTRFFCFDINSNPVYQKSLNMSAWENSAST